MSNVLKIKKQSKSQIDHDRLTNSLVKLKACREAKRWVNQQRANGVSVKDVYKSCHRCDWLAWLAYEAGIDKRKIARGVLNALEVRCGHYTSPKTFGIMREYVNKKISYDKMISDIGIWPYDPDGLPLSIVKYRGFQYFDSLRTLTKSFNERKKMAEAFKKAVPFEVFEKALS